MSDLSLRPRTVSELVDAAFRLYRQHFVALLTLSTIAYLPALIIVVAMVILIGTVTVDPAASELGTAWPIALGIAGVMAVAMIVWYPVARSAINVTASEAYFGREIDAGSAIRVVNARLGSLMAAWYAKWLMATVGLIMFVVPFFYFLARYFAIPSTVVLEDKDFGTALGRSRQLAAGQKWKILGTIVLGWLLVAAMSFAIGMVVAIGIVVAMLTRGADSLTPTSSMLLQLPSIAAYILGLPLTVVLETLLYYDMRIRQEGYDIEVMSERLAATETGAAIR